MPVTPVRAQGAPERGLVAADYLGHGDDAGDAVSLQHRDPVHAGRDHGIPRRVEVLDRWGVAAADRYVLKAFAAQLAAVRERRLRVEAGRAQQLAEANELRSALLQAEHNVVICGRSGPVVAVVWSPCRPDVRVRGG